MRLYSLRRLRTNPETSLGKKYVDFWGMVKPAFATDRTSSIFVAFIRQAICAFPDSTAAMAGAIIGANVRLEGIPHEWLSYNPVFTDMTISGVMLHRQFASFE